jgi:transcriptional regulator
VAFELQVLDIKTKIKLNQHRPESHAAMHSAYAQGNDRERELARWMVDLGMVGRGS